MKDETTRRVIVGLLWLTMLIVVTAAWSAGARQSERRETPAPPRIGTSPILDDSHPFDAPGQGTVSMPRLDRFGNEIENAVGDYRIDVRGDLYERHAPDTEMPRLRAPEA